MALRRSSLSTVARSQTKVGGILFRFFLHCLLSTRKPDMVCAPLGAGLVGEEIHRTPESLERVFDHLGAHRGARAGKSKRPRPAIKSAPFQPEEGLIS